MELGVPLAKGNRRGLEENERRGKGDKTRKTEMETCLREERLRQKEEKEELNLRRKTHMAVIEKKVVNKLKGKKRDIYVWEKEKN